jgi:hypothetical protein
MEEAINNQEQKLTSMVPPQLIIDAREGGALGPGQVNIGQFPDGRMFLEVRAEEMQNNVKIILDHSQIFAITFNAVSAMLYKHTELLGQNEKLQALYNTAKNQKEGADNATSEALRYAKKVSNQFHALKNLAVGIVDAGIFNRRRLKNDLLMFLEESKKEGDKN